MTRAEVHQRHIERLKAQRAEAKRRLLFALNWPLYTGYWTMVERTYPQKIAKLTAAIGDNQNG